MEQTTVASSTMINFTPEKLGELRHAYGQAVGAQAASFVFEGHVLLTRYACWLVKHLQQELVHREVV
jgi:hypothetical protein